MDFLNKRIILVLITIVLAFLFFYRLVLFPKQISREKQLKAVVTRLNKEKDSVRENLEKDKARLQELLNKRLDFNFTVAGENPFRERIPSFLEEIQQISSLYRIQIQKIELMNEEILKDYNRYPFSLIFLSDYSGLIRFVRHLERDLHLNVVEFFIEAEKGSNGTLIAKCILDAYELKGKEILALSKVLPTKVKKTSSNPFFDLLMNPFQRPAATTTDFNFKDPHQLQGIIRFSDSSGLDRELPKAIIDNKLYEVGDELEGKKIIDIQEDRVLFDGKTPPIVLEKGTGTTIDENVKKE
jgi:Tfp pilus assembly protein PilO